MAKDDDLANILTKLERLVAVFDLDDLDPGTQIPVESCHYRRVPATEAEIDAVEQHFHITLPDDFRAFLRLRNGWRNFAGDYHLLSTAEMISSETQETVEMIRGHWIDNPCVQEGLFFFLGDGRNFGLFDYHQKAAGSLPRVIFPCLGEKASYPSFTDYLLQQTREAEDSLRINHGIKFT